MKKLMKDSQDMVGFSIFSGVGAQVIGGVGGSGAGMANLTRFTPVMGTMSGSGAVFRTLKKIKY